MYRLLLEKGFKKHNNITKKSTSNYLSCNEQIKMCALQDSFVYMYTRNVTHFCPLQVPPSPNKISCLLIRMRRYNDVITVVTYPALHFGSAYERNRFGGLLLSVTNTKAYATLVTKHIAG